MPGSYCKECTIWRERAQEDAPGPVLQILTKENLMEGQRLYSRHEGNCMKYQLSWGKVVFPLVRAVELVRW